MASQNPTSQEIPWREAVEPYINTDLRISLWQLVNTVCPYFILWYLAYRSLEVSYWLTLAIAAVAAFFGFRTFVLMHDCGHGSFFKNQKWADRVGVFLSIVVFTPYYAWRHAHAVHHATSGDLDRRGIGDVWTMTYDEFHNAGRWTKLGYRLYRNPFIIFVIGPFFDFAVLMRVPYAHPRAKAREKNSVTWTNLTLLAIIIIAALTIGLDKYLLVQVPILAMASSLGVWFFYVQHQYENAYWSRHEDWDYVEASLYGSSYYQMPPVLQWLTGNIGFHHIHHLSPRVPNYRLEKCHYENEVFRQIEPLTIKTSLKSARIRLFDEDRGKMIGYNRPDEAVSPAVDVLQPQVEPAASGD